MFATALRVLAPAIVLVLTAAAAQAEGKKVALVVGVNTYNHASLNKPTPLQYAEADVKAVADRLKATGYAVTTLAGKEATREAILKQLDALRKAPGDGGVFLVALAGHGLQPADDSDAYFCPYDADQRIVPKDDKNPKDPWDYKTLLPLTDVLAHLKASTASTRVLLVDACRNDPASGRGRGLGTGLKIGEFLPGTAVLLACSRGQRAYEDKAWGGGHGAFFYHVLKGMDGEATDKKGRVTARSLAEYVEDAVPDAVGKVIKGGAEQKPLCLVSGDVVLRLADPAAAGAALEPRPDPAVPAKMTVGELKELHAGTIKEANAELGQLRGAGKADNAKTPDELFVDQYLKAAARLEAVTADHKAAKIYMDGVRKGGGGNAAYTAAENAWRELELKTLPAASKHFQSMQDKSREPAYVAAFAPVRQVMKKQEEAQKKLDELNGVSK